MKISVNSRKEVYPVRSAGRIIFSERPGSETLFPIGTRKDYFYQKFAQIRANSLGLSFPGKERIILSGKGDC